ncbi:MAG: AfsR family transcriptional regulator [archaeon]|nr:AfsR family transcriptional regulator [archaeon]
MSKILIQTRNACFNAELDDSDISNSIWFSLPFSNRINMLGGEIYFEFPVDDRMLSGKVVTTLERGDIAYWPKARAFCIFFDSTPLSKDDGKPVSRYPVIKIGRIIGDYLELENAGDRQKITVDRDFD